MDFFYDEQIRRLILQTIRMFGGFVVQTGLGSDGTRQIRQVPVRWGEPSRMVSQIIRLNSENKMLSTPFMSVHITAINMAPDRRQSQTLVRTDLVDERKFDFEEGKYIPNELGDRFTVKRFMPVPYNFTFQLDMWTSNQDQKMQLMEQIMMLFNPSIDLQTSDNPLDWTAITFAEMQDAITWSSKTVPFGTDEQIDVASMQFLIPYWINPPAEVTRRKAIETIIVNMRSVAELPTDDSDYSWEQGDLLAQIIITPGNHVISVEGSEITLLGEGGVEFDENGDVFSWEALLLRFADFVEDSSELIVKRKFGDPDGVTGKISFSSSPNILDWDIDPATLPEDTLDPIDAIVNPTTTGPGVGLPVAAAGQRYLLAEDIASPTAPWGTIIAIVNDIIEFDGTDWFVAFESSAATSTEVITNTFTGKQFRWNTTTFNWELAIDGQYKPGTWKVISIPLILDPEDCP